MRQTAAYWLAQMEAEDAAKIRHWMHPKYTEASKFDGIADMISNITPQWQTLPGGFWEWREMHNRYAMWNHQMKPIYEADRYPEQSWKSGGIAPINYRPSAGGIRRD